MMAGPSTSILKPRDLVIFSALLAAFFGILGLLALHKPAALVIAGVATSVALATSLLLNAEAPRSRQMLGLIIPAVLLLAGLVPQIEGMNRWLMPAALWACGGLLALLTIVQPALGRSLYHGWMDAAMPIGWTFSMLILAAVYYAVFTPIGLLLRWFGRDPMQRRFNRAASTYWIEHRQPADSSRYFRQF